ncbi:MAG: YlbF family regulator [Eubacteriales bacterium]|nr:YlbF family regulator [Eubacteriales bacterium]
MVYDHARALANDLRTSEEYEKYKTAKEAAYANESTKNLIAEYHKLQMKAQAAYLSGEKNDEQMEQLQKLGEVLQFNPAASEFLLAEYRLNTMLGDVYKILADAIDVDLSALEEK